jgi:hypothetical protein
MSKGKLIGFWILTVLVCLSQGASGVMDLMNAEPLVEAMNALGYPVYVLSILGTYKLLGAIVLAVPGLKRLKEWAYAGFFFDFTGASASHVLNGDGIDLIMPPLVLLTFVMGSYFLRPDSRKLEGPVV